MNKKQLTYKIINIESGWKITESFKVSSLLTRLENDKTQRKKREKIKLTGKLTKSLREAIDCKS